MKLAAFRDLTRFEQTLFGLPFILSGALVGVHSGASLWGLLWVIPAFMLARISGMAFNQLIDRKFDARNPRTENRALPSGRVSVKQARMVGWGALALFLLVCLQINTLTALLAAPTVILLYLYSYMKRIHPSCHLVLGAIHMLGPIMAYTAVKGELAPGVVLLGLAAACGIIGSDIAYAVQDYAFDVREGLFSAPSRLGVEKSLILAAFAHFQVPVMLLGAGLILHFPLVYYALIPLIGGFLIAFHRRLWKLWRAQGSLAGFEQAFFWCSVTISSSTFLFVLWAVLL